VSASGTRLSGEVVAAYGRRSLVETPGSDVITCLPRGRDKQYACGDRVLVTRIGRGEGVIEAADPRSSLFLRAAAHRRKLIAANASQVAVITAGEPSVNDELVCRVLVAAECQGVRGLIVLNKTDLPTPAAALRARLEPFARAGYPIVEVSAKRDVASLRDHLVGRTTVLIGQSGMGKSTIVNALVPDARATTREISRFLDSGRHATSCTRLYRLEGRSAIIDSPGIQEFGLAHLSAAEIQSGFPDLGRFVGHCRFRDCRHRAEPGCALQAAAAADEIHPRRLVLLHRLLGAMSAAR